MALKHSPSIVADGLILYLDAANTRSYPKSGTVWTDLSGNGKHGTLTNGPTFSNINNGIITFNGTNNYVSCSHPTGQSNGVTYEIFVKLNELTDNSIISFNNSTFFSGLSLINSGGIRYFIGYLSGSNYKYFYDTQVQSGVWYHVVMYVGSSDAKDIKGYVNGILDKTTTPHTGVAYSPTNLYIGASSDLGTYFLGCDVGLVRCYNRELTANEVKQNFSGTRSRFGI
jgi:hypothetical protein